MNNEPVAWIVKTYYPNGLFEDDLVWSKIDENSIPLYTHPVKEHFEDEPQAEELHEIMQSNAELTDEEILEIILKYESASGNNDTYDVLDCIREILRKASEK